jgi:hypothetical protein
MADRPDFDLAWAVNSLRSSQRRTLYRLASDYYLGDHRLAFATDKFQSEFGERLKEFSDNLCPAVVDSLVDRLTVTGFDVAQQEALSAHAWDIWQRNRMDMWASDVHREALLKGDGYVIVWPDPLTGDAVFWPQEAELMAVRYDPDTPDKIVLAAKLWADLDGYWRLNLYYPDRIEKYRSQAQVYNWTWSENAWKNFWPLSSFAAPDVAASTQDTVPNPWGEVPVFHMPNKQRHWYGWSELLDVIPLQDALNKAGADMLVAMEFSAFRQRWVTGMKVEVGPDGKPKAPPFEAGVDRIFSSSDPNARFGTFDASDLKQFLAVQEDLRAEIARVSGTPLHYLFITRGDFPSGEAMKSAEARFTRKIQDRQVTFGNRWEEALAFALRVEGENVVASDVETLWETASPRSESELLVSLGMKQAIGIPQEQLWREAGYTVDQIQRMREMKPVTPDPGSPGAPTTGSGGQGGASGVIVEPWTKSLQQVSKRGV